MSLLNDIEAADLKVPLKDITDDGSVYRSVLYKVETIRPINTLPTWKRITLSLLDTIKRKLAPVTIKSVSEVPIREDMYPVVVFLKENCGYSLSHSLIIAASLCQACLDYISLELKEDTFTIQSMTKLIDLDPDCPVCKLRKKAFYSRPKVQP